MPATAAASIGSGRYCVSAPPVRLLIDAPFHGSNANHSRARSRSTWAGVIGFAIAPGLHRKRSGEDTPGLVVVAPEQRRLNALGNPDGVPGDLQVVLGAERGRERDQDSARGIRSGQDEFI